MAIAIISIKSPKACFIESLSPPISIVYPSGNSYLSISFSTALLTFPTLCSASIAALTVIALVWLIWLIEDNPFSSLIVAISLNAIFSSLPFLVPLISRSLILSLFKVLLLSFAIITG